MHGPRRHKYYVLDERKRARPATMLESAQADTLGSLVAETNLELCRVSTVFFGVDLRMAGEGPPILFETMVFPVDEGLKESRGCRYSTWAEAEVGHMEIVEAVREEIAQLERRAGDAAEAVLDQAAKNRPASADPGA